MTHIFDGKIVANEKRKELATDVARLENNGIKPKLVSILVGDDKASKLYLSLKKAAALGVGADLEIRELSKDVAVNEIIDIIKELNTDETVHGIMIQLPLPDNFSKKERDQIIDNIVDEKDVDGMKKDSPYLTPVIKAILIALKDANDHLPIGKEVEIVVVGSKGFVGSRALRVLNDMGYKTLGIDRNTDNWEEKIKSADVVISATGEENIITGDLIKAGVVIIDVGSPKPDVNYENIKEKASFLSPVPGGVGPLTVILLIENLIEAARGGVIHEKKRT